MRLRTKALSGLHAITSREAAPPVGLVDADQLDVEQQGPVDAGVVEDEVQRSFSAEGRRFRTDLVVGGVVLRARVAEIPVRDDDLPDPADAHGLQGELDALDDVALPDDGPGVILVLVEGPALRSALGLEGPAEVPDRVTAPFVDGTVTRGGGSAGSDLHVPVGPSLGGLREVLVLLQVDLVRRGGKGVRGGDDGGRRRHHRR
mmetsp:Transcript_23610/g.55941  ORF Transcript_23610/g.55941 Transcript_23610/m.55941 type:complete len:203 (+) Transcript_23610:257-865(+)